MKLETGKSGSAVQPNEGTNILTFISLAFNTVMMKRLHRILLAGIAIVSLIGFLLYKHEYDRLSNLLHVLHTFSQTSCSELPIKSSSNEVFATNPSALFGVWQKIGPVFTYSAVWDSESIKIFAMIAVATSIKELQFTKCMVRHVDVDAFSHSVIEGSLSIEIETLDRFSQSDVQWRAVYFVCKCPAQAKAIPYSVSLNVGGSKSHPLLHSIPVTRLGSLAARTDSTNITVAICAPITSHNLDKNKLNQFIQFHSYIGVNRITLYDVDTSPETLRQLNEAQLQNPETTLQILPWNFPSEMTTDEVDSASFINMMKRDCTLRHSDEHYAILINTDQLVVPRFHSHLSNLLHDEQELDDSMGIAHIVLKTFCTEFQSDPYIKLLPDVFPMFLKTYWAQPTDEEKDVTVVVNPRAIRGFTAVGVPVIKPGYHELRVDEELAAIHTYRECGPNASYPHFDNVIYRKFGNHFMPNFNL